MLLTPRTLLLLLLAAFFLAGATFAPLLMVLAVAYLVLVLLMVMADVLISPRPTDFQVSRTHDARLSLGAENDVTVSVTHDGKRATQVWVRDEYPVTFKASAEILDFRFRISDSDYATQSKIQNLKSKIDPSETALFKYTITPPRRGDYAFGDINLRWQGVWGLVVRQARYPASGPVRVYPNLLDIRKYELLARKGQLAELGFRKMRLLGGGSEFERLRDYTADDEFRHIDWNAMARRGRPIAREYETERSQNIIVLLDVGRLMRAPVTGSDGQTLEKVDFAVNATLMLSYVAGLRGDKVGLLAFADDVQTYLAPKAGKAQFYRLLATLYAIQPQPVEVDYARAFAHLNTKHKKRSLIVIFTDLASGMAGQSIVSQVAPLIPRHVPLLVAINDPSVVALAQQPIADSTSAYQRAVAEQALGARTLTMQSLRQRGVNTLDVPANQLTVAVVNRYLELKSRARI